MPSRRYRQPSASRPEDERLPLDTQLTILTRQSTVKQSQHNVFSAEVNPDELVREGQRLGYNDIQVVDWDTGIGAYSTVIEDRPGLQHWLNDLLPNGVSRVLMVSQEDRLFRDKWETQHNRFIQQVATFGGWVICGTRVYNFRREFDCEQFRMACKYGRLYVEHHIIHRMHPAIHRSAMAGRYTGGSVPWGYRVDYERRSSTYMHYVRYEPHAELVTAQLFERFARLLQPSVVELARQWDREGLVFPFFGPDVDDRQSRYMDAHCRRDELRGGYPLHFKTAQRILTDVAYIGWRVRASEVARDEYGAPLVCHEPLVAPDLFWWCYDHIVPERPAWSDSWAPARRAPVVSYRQRAVRTRALPGQIRFLAAGKVRCSIHDKVLVPATSRRGPIELHCGQESHFGFTPCAHVSALPVEQALCGMFLDILTLDDRDVISLAQLAQQRQAQQSDGAMIELRRRLNDERGRYERAKRVVIEAPDLAPDMMSDIRTAKQAIQDLESQLESQRVSVAPTAQAFVVAERAAALAGRIRATFGDWPREAQARVLALALDDSVLGWVSRHVIGVWVRWVGGEETRQEIVSRAGRHVRWSTDEVEALRRSFGSLTWDALQTMFPGRSVSAITQHANRLGLARPDDGGSISVPSEIFPEPQTANSMAAYGFRAVGVSVESGILSSSLSSLASSRRSSG